MGQLTESARQYLVSQGIVIGTVSVLASLSLILTGLVVIVRANDILQFTSLIHLAVLQLVCGVSSGTVVAFVWWTIVGYRNRQLEIRSKYLDDNLTKGLLALCIPLFINYSAFIVSVVFLIVKGETTSRHEMRNAMSLYTSNMREKVFIDRLQIILRCCGSQSIMDWFLIDWQEGDSGGRTSYNSSADWDSVPFSCCCPEAPPPCVHQRLRIFGVSSLYAAGCADKLDKAVLIFITVSLFMFLICSLSMSLLMYSSRKVQTSARSAIEKGDATAPGEWWIFAPKGAQTREEQPLLPMGRNIEEEVPKSTNATVAEFCFTQNNFHGYQDLLNCQMSKIIDSTVNEDWAAFNSVSVQPEAASSEDWPMRMSNISRSTSVSSFSTGSVVCNYSADSRRSVSDTEVANLEVSQHLEHKIRPLYRS
ncbi:UNVERIFIED_CONTAM: hypothetical protein PYX00_007065 [Menopon gallinae]|uniref:Tetraspanin n=1 Tax=Menopon gallinae TaxID=328185 RepID=A0AAW2HI97_9NEOP